MSGKKNGQNTYSQLSKVPCLNLARVASRCWSPTSTRFFGSTSLAMLSRSNEALAMLPCTAMLYLGTVHSLEVLNRRQWVVNWYQQVPQQLVLCLDWKGLVLEREEFSSGADEVATSSLAGLVTAASSVFMLMVAWCHIELSGIHDSLLYLGIKQLATSSRFSLRKKLATKMHHNHVTGKRYFLAPHMVARPPCMMCCVRACVCSVPWNTYKRNIIPSDVPS